MLKKISSLLVLGLVIAIPLFLIVHMWLTDRRGVLQAIYPAQALFSDLNSKCSDGSPPWLHSIAKAGVWDLKALASQVAFINSQGEVFSCQSGWVNGFLSKPVEETSRFYYGSLTKPITSSALLYLEKYSDFSLSTSVLDFFKINSPEEASAITIEDIMRHLSGIKGHVFYVNKRPWCPYAIDKNENLQFDETLKGKTRYSNLGYCVLGEIVGRELGVSYRQAMQQLFNLENRGITFSELGNNVDLVNRDFRYNDFYGAVNPGKFDYYAISATAGMVGSASAYAGLIKDLLREDLNGFLNSEVDGCDRTKIRNCYGKVFYVYKDANGRVMNIKEGYMPGSSGIVVVNDKNEIFVWLGNSDTPSAVTGVAMKAFIDHLARSGF